MSNTFTLPSCASLRRRLIFAWLRQSASQKASSTSGSTATDSGVQPHAGNKGTRSSKGSEAIVS
eukprot:scaffold2131_cov384-Prasinococcus_capsulatus_cf.AAC.9